MSRVSAKMRLARPAISRPASVSMMPLRLRSSNCTPSVFSRSWICMESAGWGTAHCSAALPKCRVRATASKYLNCLNDIIDQIFLSGIVIITIRPDRQPLLAFVDRHHKEKADEQKSDPDDVIRRAGGRQPEFDH